MTVTRMMLWVFSLRCGVANVGGSKLICRGGSKLVYRSNVP